MPLTPEELNELRRGRGLEEISRWKPATSEDADRISHLSNLVLGTGSQGTDPARSVFTSEHSSTLQPGQTVTIERLNDDNGHPVGFTVTATGGAEGSMSWQVGANGKANQQEDKLDMLLKGLL